MAALRLTIALLAFLRLIAARRLAAALRLTRALLAFLRLSAALLLAAALLRFLL